MPSSCRMNACFGLSVDCFEMRNKTRTGNEKRGQSRLSVQTSPNSSKNRRFTVTETTGLLEFLLKKLSGQSATSIKQLLKHRCISVNDGEAVTQFDYVLNPGDVVSLVSASENRFALHHLKLRILYEDDYLIAVDKATGLHSVDTTGGGCENACTILENYIRRRDPTRRIYIVHRLDRDTSGVLIFAKCREAQNRLIADWNDRVEERAYIAVIEGSLTPNKGTIESWLYEDEHKVVHSTNDPNKGLHAVTHYEVVKSNDKWTKVRLDLETGRTNQIRVHLESLGHPIIGDEKYGSKANPIHRLGLHALNIRFVHPITGRMMSFMVPEPSDFDGLFQ